MEKQYYVYILSSVSKVIYIGVTSDLAKRVYEHKQGEVDGFTKKYKVKSLAYYEVTNDVNGAIQREKQLKAWRREKKVKLIETMNPDWTDLYDSII